MKHFSYLKQLINTCICEKTYNEVEFEGETYKEIVIGDDVAYDKLIENAECITIDTDNLIIDGGGHYVDLNHESHAFSILSKNVIIKNFNFTSTKNHLNGGAIHNSGTLRIENCLFMDCEASEGGAIYNNGLLIVAKSTFKNNNTSHISKGGGAICNDYIALVFHCEFINNHARSYGGAIFNTQSLFVSDCTFKNNSSDTGGGTINTEYSSFGVKIDDSLKEIIYDFGIECTINDSVFEDSDGSVIKSNSLLDIKNCIFRNCNNILRIEGSTVNINSCLFENNQSYIIENIYSSILHSQVHLDNCDFIANKSDINEILLKTSMFKVKNSYKHWTVKNCRFINNASNYIFHSNFSDISFENVCFKDNDFEILLYSSTPYDKNNIVKLNNVTFNEKLEDIILCDGNLEINQCRFKKHHKINNERAFDIYESENNFKSKFKDN